jgi:cobalamin biosynthesis protein CbiD
MITLELTEDEFIALMALVGVGMNTYLGLPKSNHEFAIERMPQEVFDSLTAKFNVACNHALNTRGERRK